MRYRTEYFMQDTSYDDIINLSRPVSKNHTPMPRESRAAQFAPFAALTGYDASVKEEARLTGDKLELTEEQEKLLNAKMAYLTEKTAEHPTVKVTCFIADERKSGGEYVTLEGSLYVIDKIGGVLVLSDTPVGKVKVPVSDVFSIESEIFTDSIFDAF